MFVENWRDPPIQVAADCSFKDAGHRQAWIVGGKPAQSLGNGHTVQTIASGDVCVVRERLLVVDCNAGTLIAVEGRPSRNAPDFGSDPDELVKNIVRPKGGIRLNKKTTLERVSKAAKRKGYAASTDLSAELADLGARNRYDPFCGCKLHYPDSKGATQ